MASGLRVGKSFQHKQETIRSPAYNSRLTPNMADTPIRDRVASKTRAKSRRARLLPFFTFLLFACAMAGMVAGSAYLGVQSGGRELNAKRTATVGAIIMQRFESGNVQLREQKYALAQASFEEVLRYQPGNIGARDLMATAVVAQTPEPKPTVNTPTPVVTDRGALLTRARAATEREDWDTVLSLTEQLTAIDPLFEKQRVANLRWDALVARGTARLRGDNAAIEPGLFDLDQAAAIRELPTSLVTEQKRATSYQTALQYLGADWDRAIFLLSQLPQGYRDVAQQLFGAYINAGDSYAELQEWCPAAEKYADAVRVASSAKLEAKQREAAQQCLVATPTISGTVAPGVGVSGMTVLPSSGIAGQIFFNVYDNGQYLPYALDLATNSISALSNQYGTGSVLSPDNTRTVESVYVDNAWQLVIRSAAGTAALTPGTAPQWGPLGYIAYQGCSDQCGIHIVNPDQPGSTRRVTSWTGDIAFKWAPQGDRLAYMSNYNNGAFELYTVSINGDFRQLTAFGGSTGAPAWSPDGGQIAFLSNRDGAFGLFTMNADGSGVQKIVDFGQLSPAWQSPLLSWVDARSRCSPPSKVDYTYSAAQPATRQTSGRCRRGWRHRV